MTIKCGVLSENVLRDTNSERGQGQARAWGRFLEVGRGMKEEAGDQPGSESPHSVGVRREWVTVEVDMRDGLRLLDQRPLGDGLHDSSASVLPLSIYRTFLLLVA